MKKFRNHLSVLAGIALLFLLNALELRAAGIDQKGLAANLTFENLINEQPNFDVQGFTVSDEGGLVVDVIITWRSAGEEIGSTEVSLAVLSVSGGCDGLSVEIQGLYLHLLGSNLGFEEVNFDIYAGDLTPAAVQSLLCTAGHLADAGVNATAMAFALNRTLPAIL
jgi:hypothetical protein